MKLSIIALIVSMVGSCAHLEDTTVQAEKITGDESTHPAWLHQLDAEIEDLGTYNWIIVAEPAYPAFSKSGVTTVSVPVESAEALDLVFQIIDAHGHVTPRIYVTRESKFITEKETPGIREYRAGIRKAFNGRTYQALPDNALEMLVLDAKKDYKVLVIKTMTALPYDSIFLELEPGYWDAESETSLRKRMIR